MNKIFDVMFYFGFFIMLLLTTYDLFLLFGHLGAIIGTILSVDENIK